MLAACIVCSDGLKGLPAAIGATWPLALVPMCLVHLMCNRLWSAAKARWATTTRRLRTAHTAATAKAAQDALTTVAAAAWEPNYPAMVAIWRWPCADLIPFLDLPVGLRTMIHATKGTGSLNARFRAAARRRGHLPDEEPALTVLQTAIREGPLTRANPTSQKSGWNSILNVLSMTDRDRHGLN